MRKGLLKPPRPKDVKPVLRALVQHIPMDAPLMYGMRESIRHVPNFRIKAQTNEIEWFVDIYKGSFYHVSVKGSKEIFTTIPTLVTYLWRMLGVRPKQTP
jgi:hypothetical protein